MNVIINQISEQIKALLLQKNFILIGIDGKSCAGKSTLAAQLSRLFDCNVWHTDDFVVPHAQKTANRLAEPGGNFDYERFGAEVLDKIINGQSALYRAYDCKADMFMPAQKIKPRRINIVEGAYCLHPAIHKLFDLTIFMDIDYSEQLRRLAARCPEKLDAFVSRWIPLENAYINATDLRGRCDMIFDAEIFN